jgi:hypothetical protein
VREREREIEREKERQTERSEMFSGSTINMKRTHTGVVCLHTTYIKWINIVIFNFCLHNTTIVMCKRERERASEREKERERERERESIL